MFVEGQSVQAKSTITDPTGKLFDPVTVRMKIRQPDATTETVTPTRESEGVYTRQIVIKGTGVLWVDTEGINGLSELVAFQKQSARVLKKPV